MHLEPDSVVECQVTLGALEGLLTGVDPLVFREVRLLLEGLIAHRTHEWPLVGVHADVVVE